MDVLLIISVIISIPLLALGALFGCIAGFKRVCRKGYSPPVAVLVLVWGAVAGVLSLLAVLPRVALDRTGLFFYAFFWLPAIVSFIATTLLILVLPVRNARRAGARQPRFPFFVAGVAVVLLGVGFVVWMMWEGAPASGALKFLIIPTGFGVALMAIGSRVKKASTIEAVTQTDPRAPVVYIRPFAQEELPFVVGKKSTLGPYLSEARSLITSGDDETDWNVSVRFEQYLGKAFNSRIGPLVALGNPEDYVPPDGAARTYASDSGWKEYVEHLATTCSCLVAEIGISDNLRWELEYLRQQGLQRKLFIMTRPAALKHGWFDKLFLWAMMIKLISWDSFAETMTAAGYEILEDPGPGSVFTFDEVGKALILKTGAKSPEDYVAPIRNFLETTIGHAPESFDVPLTTVHKVVDLPVPDSSPTANVKPDDNRRPLLSRILRGSAITGIIILFCFGSPIYKYFREKSRTQDLKIVASQIKFKFNDGDLHFESPDLAGMPLINNWDGNGVVFNEMEGEAGGRQAILFDYRYEVKVDDRKGGTDTITFIQTVAGFSSPDSKLPPFELQEFSVWHALGIRGERVEIGDPEFSKRFIVTSQQHESASRLFSNQLRNFLTKGFPRGDWRLDGGGPWVLVYQPKVRVKPKDWQSFLSQTSQTADGFFQNLVPEASSQAVMAK